MVRQREKERESAWDGARGRELGSEKMERARQGRDKEQRFAAWLLLALSGDNSCMCSSGMPNFKPGLPPNSSTNK